MKFRRASMVLVGALATVAICGRALAAPPERSRVAVVRSSPSDPLLRDANTRLRAELSEAGFEVVDVERPPGGARIEVESATGDEQTFATIAIERTGSGAFADVWIGDRVTGKTVVRRLSVGAASNAAAVLAIRALELLRASLLEIASAPPSARSAEPASDVLDWAKPAAIAGAAPTPNPFAGTRVSLGVIGLHGLQEIGPALGPVARVSRGIGDHVFARLSLAAPLIAPTASAEGGTASVSQQFLSLDFGWATAARPIGAFGWAGLGASYLYTAGTAVPPFNSTSSGVVSFLAAAGIGGVARLSRTVALTTEISVLGLVPYPVVVIADREVGKVGTPSVGAALGLALEL